MFFAKKLSTAIFCFYFLIYGKKLKGISRMMTTNVLWTYSLQSTTLVYLLNFVKFRQKLIFSSRRPVFVISSVFGQKLNLLHSSCRSYSIHEIRYHTRYRISVYHEPVSWICTSGESIVYNFQKPEAGCTVGQLRLNIGLLCFDLASLA